MNTENNGQDWQDRQDWTPPHGAPRPPRLSQMDPSPRSPLPSQEARDSIWAARPSGEGSAEPVKEDKLGTWFTTALRASVVVFFLLLIWTIIGALGMAIWEVMING